MKERCNRSDTENSQRDRGFGTNHEKRPWTYGLLVKSVPGFVEQHRAATVNGAKETHRDG